MMFAAACENRMMSHSASASCANAASPCVNTVILDAITLASIIISLPVLGVSLVLAGLLSRGKLKKSDAAWARESW